jgi:hypothetical protein
MVRITGRITSCATLIPPLLISAAGVEPSSAQLFDARLSNPAGVPQPKALLALC